MIDLKGWTKFDKEAPPPRDTELLVWCPWREDQMEVRYLLLLKTFSTVGKVSYLPAWYPGGSGTRGTYWMEKPPTPELE